MIVNVKRVCGLDEKWRSCRPVAEHSADSWREVLQHVKNLFYVFYYCHVFYVFNVFFIFRTFFTIKNVENLLSLQANSEVSVLHFTNDWLNCSGLLLLSTIFAACWAYYMRVCI